MKRGDHSGSGGDVRCLSMKENLSMVARKEWQLVSPNGHRHMIISQIAASRGEAHSRPAHFSIQMTSFFKRYTIYCGSWLALLLANYHLHSRKNKTEEWLF